jgi:peptidoglycan/xylan/chitin deacetylase (PgdA/CDA1 family)
MLLRIIKEYLRNRPGLISIQDSMRLQEKEPGGMDTLFAFTCDLEISPEARSRRNACDNRLVKGYGAMQDILTRYEVTGTFFAEGRICQEHPEMVEELCQAGHEIGSHGFGHIPMTYVWPTAFLPIFSDLKKRRADIRKSKDIINAIVKKTPVSFRSPHMAIDQASLRILEEEGFLLDSSLYNPAFGKLSFPYHPSENDLVNEGKMNMLEIPVTVSVFPQRKVVYYRYPTIFELEAGQIERAVSGICEVYSRLNYPFSLFATLIHPYELCSPMFISKVSNFLRSMKKIGARGLTFLELLKEWEHRVPESCGNGLTS